MSTVDRVLGGILIGLAALLLAVGECLYLNLRVGGTAVPVAQVVAILANLLLPFAAVRLTGARLAAALPGAVWIIVALAFAAHGPGGDVIVPGNWQGMLLLIGGAGAAVVGFVVAPGPRTPDRPERAASPAASGNRAAGRSRR